MRLPLSIALLSAALISSSAGWPTPVRADDPPAADKPATLPRLQRVAIGNTGAATYLPGAPEWKETRSEDGTLIVNGAVSTGDAGAGVVAVRFAKAMTGLEDSAREDVLIGYMQHLAEHVFALVEQAPPGRGHRLSTHPAALGVLMIGKDRDATEVWMKGWIDADGIGVAYVFADQMPPISWTEAVLQGFRFPGD